MGVLAGTHWGASDAQAGRMGSGAERQPLWLRCVGGGGHVMWTFLIHAFYKHTSSTREVTLLTNLLTAISYQRICLLLALLFCLRLALLFLHGFLGSDPGSFFFVLHVRLIRVLLLTSPVAGCDRVTVSRSKHALQTSFVPILGFGSRLSLALVGLFSPDCDFLFVIVLDASLSCATSRLVCSSSSILW